MTDTDLIRDTLIHIEALQALLAAMRVGRRTPEKALDTLDRTASVPRRLQEALAATPAPLDAAGPEHVHRGQWCAECLGHGAALVAVPLAAPDGLHPTDDYAEIIDRWKAIAEEKYATVVALRAALDGLVAACEAAMAWWAGEDEWDAPEHDALRVALATAKEAGDGS